MRNVFIAALLTVFLLPLYSQKTPPMNYDTQWQKVADFEKKSLPQSAADETAAILKKAIADKNTPQIIKAVIHKAKYKMAVDAEEGVLIFNDTEQLIANSSDKIEKAVLHSMLAELYMQFYLQNQWKINQRTDLGDFVPTDMQEWTRNIFYNKVLDNIKQSLSERGLLEKAQLEPYVAIIDLGKDSRRYFPSFYDFLARRSIDIMSDIQVDEDLSKTLSKKNIPVNALFAPADKFVSIDFNPGPEEYGLWTLELYRQYLSSLIERGMKQSVLLTELDRLDYLQKFDNANHQHAKSFLKKLLDEWQDDPISVEIIDLLSEIYLEAIDDLTENDGNTKQQKTKELYDLLSEAEKRFPHYDRIGIVKNRLENLTQPQFLITTPKTFSTSGEKKFSIASRNMRSLKATLYKVASATETEMLRNQYSSEKKPKRKLVQTLHIDLPAAQPYIMSDTTFAVSIDNPGIYMLELEGDKPQKNAYNNSTLYFSVSNLAVFSRALPNDVHEFYVVNGETGIPVPNAQIHIYKLPGNWRNSTLTLQETIYTDKNGLATYHKTIPNNDVYFQAVMAADEGFMLERLGRNYNSYTYGNDKRRDFLNIYTDRSLYRPGQTVYFKAIAYSNENDGTLSVNKKIKLTLQDANYKELSQQTLTTNEFGSVTGEFIIPQGLLTGTFSIQSEQGSVFFKVEEYKRPTFTITFDKIAGTYKFGEPVTIKGEAENYSGIKLQDATVNYSITRQQMWWRFWGGQNKFFDEGIVQTDENGKFEIVFTPLKADNSDWRPQAYIFSIEAKITDQNGETQTGVFNLSVGDVSMMLETNLPASLEKSDKRKLMITAKNLNGEEVKAEGRYKLFALSEKDTVLHEVQTGTFTTGEQTTLRQTLTQLPSGKYRLILTSKDDRNNEVKSESDFILYAFSDKRPPIETNDWYVVKSNIFGANRKAEVILGATGSNVHVLYELYSKSTLLERKWVVLNNENKHFVFDYKPGYKDGLTLMLTHIKDRKFYAHREEITTEKEQKDLSVVLKTFRDKVRPGSNETWTISVKDSLGNPALAEVLASMYDYSLEQIYPAEKWRGFYFAHPMLPRTAAWRFGDLFGMQQVTGYFNGSHVEVAPFKFDQFKWYDFSFYFHERMLMRNLSVMEEKVVVGYGAPAPKMADEAESIEMTTGKTRSEEVVPPAPQETTPQLRKNFNETAFFFPRLTTDAKGETVLSFTVPESNTRWKFRALAHDKKMNAGQTEAFTVSQKELMVTPNLPRFLRQGDRASVSTKVSNLSDGSLQGTVTLEFFNVLTEEVMSGISIENPRQTFALEKGTSQTAEWQFHVPVNMDLLGIRIVAKNDKFSDGEQHALAILPNRIMVTESMRMDVNAGEDKIFTFDRLTNSPSDSQQNYRLTLEFASNPAWFAVQALPVLSEPSDNNSVSWFAAYYANAMGAHIIKKYPKVSAMIKAWQSEGGTSESLISNLEKNRELKEVLLEETPWVLEAKTETEQKQKLSLLFDLNRNQNLTSTALAKLKDLQTTQGGWSWFKGFYPNVAITQYILYGFNQLKELDAIDTSTELQRMQSAAVSYIDSEALNRFEQMKKWNKDWKTMKSISHTDLEYVYVRSMYTQYKYNDEVKSMIDFYLTVLQNNWTSLSLYQRALVAIMMQKAGLADMSKAIIGSFREHASHNEEMGMYWANNRAGVFMSQSAVSVHTFIMEAFKAAGAGDKEMDDMKRWLLKQKQTRMWESTHATLDAVYALLSTGGDWFGNENKTRILLGSKTVEPSGKAAGTGYFKVTWQGAEILPQMGNVRVVQEGKSPAWGALYLQYFEDLNKITKTDGAPGVEKKLFIEQVQASGKKLVQIGESSPLKVGDKVVVRLTVTADRDLEFVHLKDMRAACFEPVDQLSVFQWKNGVPYYQTSKDASTNIYFDTLPRGTYVFEYAVYVARTGVYSNGITTLQSMYAPEFSSHTAGIEIIVK